MRKTINEIIGEPVDISLLGEDPTSKIAFELYKESMMLVIIICNICETEDDEEVLFSRNQAVQVGLLIRIVKFMTSVLSLTTDKTKNHGEVIMALNRCIVESSIKLIYFTSKASSDDFDDFIKSGLKPEKEFHKSINENISKRGKVLPIEKRMLKSINQTISASGLNSIDDLNDIPRWKDFRSILRALDMEELYTAIQQIPSHSIHGTWADLILHHLKYKDKKYISKFESIVPDARLFTPISKIVIKALESYLKSNFSKNEKITPIVERIKDLDLRIDKVDNFHEQELAGNS